jgi:hypothetical protein
VPDFDHDSDRCNSIFDRVVSMGIGDKSDVLSGCFAIRHLKTIAKERASSTGCVHYVGVKYVRGFHYISGWPHFMCVYKKYSDGK